MAEARTLTIAMQRATANAHIANDTWRVDGAVRSGTLADPTLPGSVSTIAGRWSAAPDENDGPIIRVEAGEALLTANRPASEEERPLFNPLRLANVDASVRNGRIDATGAILLADRARQLAHFMAQHGIDEGAGDARVIAENIVFGNDLQPYEITEQARGMVENVRGPASLNANIMWTRDAITSSGTVGLNGVSLATSTIPVVQDVRGDIYFDDLFELTTPPGQQITIGLLNPGIAVRNGRVTLPVAAGRARFNRARRVRFRLRHPRYGADDDHAWRGRNSVRSHAARCRRRESDQHIRNSRSRCDRHRGRQLPAAADAPQRLHSERRAANVARGRHHFLHRQRRRRRCRTRPHRVRCAARLPL